MPEIAEGPTFSLDLSPSLQVLDLSDNDLAELPADFSAIGLGGLRHG